MSDDGPRLWRRARRALRLLEWTLVALGALAIVAAIVALWALRTGRAAEALEARLVAEVRAACDLELEFVSLRIEPTEASLHLSGLELATAEGAPLLSVSQAFAELRVLPLLRGRLEIPQVTLRQPRAVLRVADGRLADLPSCLKSEGGSGRPPPLGLEAVSMEDGRFRLQLEDVAELELSGVSAATWPVRTGGNHLDVRVGAGTLTRDGRATPLEGLTLVGHVSGPVVSPRSAKLDRLQASLGPLEVDARGELDLLGPVYDLSVGAAVDLGGLGRLGADLPEMSGALALQVDVRGVGLSPEVRGEAVARAARVGKFALGELARAELRADPGGVDIEDARLRLGPGEVRVEGRVDFDDELGLRATARTKRLSFARLMGAIGERGVWVDFLASGRSQVKGSLRPLRISGPFDFDLEGVDVYDGPWDDPASRRPEARRLDTAPVEVAGRWTFTKSALRVDEAEVSTERSRGRASALVRHQDPKRLDVRADFERLGLADLGGIAGIDFRGLGPVSGRVGGPFGDLSAAATLDLRGIAIAGIPLGDALAELRWDGGDALTVAGIEGTLGSTRWHGGVDVDFRPPTPVRVKGEITRGRLGDLLLPLGLGPAEASKLAGAVRGRFELDGPVSAWTGPLRLEARGVAVAGERLGDLRARGRMAKGRVVVERLELEEGPARTRAAGWLVPADKTFELRASTQGLRLRALEVLNLPRLEGVLGATARLEGTLARPKGRVDLKLAELAAGELELGTGQGAFELESGAVDLEGQIPELGATIEGRARLTTGLPFEARIELARAPAPRLVGELFDLDLSGWTSLAADLRGRLGAPGQIEGRVDVSRLRAEVAGMRLRMRTPETLRIVAGDLVLDEVVVAGEELRLTASGPAGRDRLDLDLDGRLDLRRLSTWVPGIGRAAGSFAFTGSLSRAAGGVDLVGTGRVEDGALAWRGIPNRFSGIRGGLTFSQRSVIVEELSGRWAGGRLRVNGSMLLEDLEPRGVALDARVEGARPRLSLPWMDLSARLDGGVTITGDWPRLSVGGVLEVSDGRAVPRTDLSQLVGARRLAAAYDPSAEILQLDIGLPIQGIFRVKNDDIDVALTGELRLTGTNERLGLLGALNLEQGGRLSVVGREYVTEGGLIEMADRYRVEPRYDLQLSASACDARIQLNLVGDLDEVRTSYASNPEMDREDIVSCLVRGIRRRDLDQDLYSFAGSALLKLSGVDRQVKKVLPIDQIDVTTEFSSRARAYEPRILVAKDLSLLDRSFRLEYSTSIFRTDDQRAALRVRLTPQLSLQLGWTSSEDVPMGDWGLDLKRRWEW